MDDDFADDAADWVPANWMAELEAERRANVDRYAGRYAAGCDLWTGEPSAEAARSLAEYLEAQARLCCGAAPAVIADPVDVVAMI